MEMLDRKRKETLEKKRSFFVRMVSDPKIYNPAINKAGTPRISSDSYSPIAEGAPAIQTPTTAYVLCSLFSPLKPIAFVHNYLHNIYITIF